MGIMTMNSMDFVEGYPKTHRQIQDMFRFRSDGLAPARGKSDSGACGRTFADLWSDWKILCRLCIAIISMLYWSISVQLEICWCRHRISQAIPAVSAKSECQTSRFRGKLNQYSHTFPYGPYVHLEQISRPWTNHHHLAPRPEELFPVVIFRGGLEAIVEGVHANVLTKMPSPNPKRPIEYSMLINQCQTSPPWNSQQNLINII